MIPIVVSSNVVVSLVVVEVVIVVVVSSFANPKVTFFNCCKDVTVVLLPVVPLWRFAFG